VRGKEEKHVQVELTEFAYSMFVASLLAGSAFLLPGEESHKHSVGSP